MFEAWAALFYEESMKVPYASDMLDEDYHALDDAFTLCAEASRWHLQTCQALKDLGL